MEEIQDIRGLLAGVDADKTAQILALLKKVETKLMATNSARGAIKKKRVKEPKFLQGPDMAISLAGMNNKERAAMRAFFQ